jgi:hypothetical protein
MRDRFRTTLGAVALTGLLGLSVFGLSWGTSATDAPTPPVSTPITTGKVVVMPVATLEEGPAGVRSDVYKYDGWVITASNTGLVMQRDPSADIPRTGGTATEPQTPLSR